MIKFRAWNTSQGYMVRDYAHFDKHGKLVITLTSPDDEYEPLLYTGLPDKDGNEIAAADIVEDQFGLLYEVRFGAFMDTKCHVQYGFYLYNFREKISLGNMGYDVDEQCPLKVIGTSYENPELLQTVDK